VQGQPVLRCAWRSVKATYRQRRYFEHCYDGWRLCTGLLCDVWKSLECFIKVSDMFGNIVFEQHAAKPGTVILLRHVARVEAGDSLLIIV